MKVARVGGLTVRFVGGADGEGGPATNAPTVVLLHGFGAPGDDLVPLADELDAPAGTRFLFPQAPTLLPPELGGGEGRAWWMIDVMRLSMALMLGNARDLTREVPEGLAAARSEVEGMLDALVREHGVERERLVLGGFSQGAMLACDVALRTHEPLAGLVLMSGTFLAEDEWRPLMPARAGLAVLQSHGTSDPLLPFEVATRLRDALTEAGLAVDFVSFAGGHGIAPSVMERLGELLRSLAG